MAHLPSMYRTLGSTPSTMKTSKKNLVHFFSCFHFFKALTPPSCWLCLYENVRHALGSESHNKRSPQERALSSHPVMSELSQLIFFNRSQHGQRLHVPSRCPWGTGSPSGPGWAHYEPCLFLLPAHSNPRLPGMWPRSPRLTCTQPSLFPHFTILLL